MLQIKRVGHSTLTTPDLERMVDYFTRIVGLSLVARDKRRAVLATKAGLEAIVLERGEAAAAPRLSFQVASDTDLGGLATQLKKAGIKSEHRSDITPGIGAALAFQDPKGTIIEVFSDCRFAKDDGKLSGVMPLKFGHIAYQYPDVKGLVKFYCDLLGFRVSDWRSDFFAFLRCSRDHHTVNFLHAPKASIHHIAFEVRDWSDIRRACDFLALNDIKLNWGPIRHIIGHNIAIYHKCPDGIVIEFFCELDQMHDEELGFFEPRPWHQDRPQRPKVWDDDTPANWWGPMSRGPSHDEAPAAKRPASFAHETPAALAPAKKKRARKSRR